MFQTILGDEKEFEANDHRVNSSDEPQNFIKARYHGLDALKTKIQYERNVKKEILESQG